MSPSIDASNEVPFATEVHAISPSSFPETSVHSSNVAVRSNAAIWLPSPEYEPVIEALPPPVHGPIQLRASAAGDSLTAFDWMLAIAAVDCPNACSESCLLGRSSPHAPNNTETAQRSPRCFIAISMHEPA